MELSGAARNVLQDDPKAVFHMRSQLTRQKFMPIFGAGVGRDLGLPVWGDLVSAIADHPDIDGAQLDVSREGIRGRRELNRIVSGTISD